MNLLAPRPAILAPFLVFVALASSALAATKTYVAQAGAIPQIDSITVANTWAAGDTATVAIGNSTLTVTCGSATTTTSQVADVLKRAINATRIDENLVADEARNGAGQLIGEFRDVEAIIDPTNSSRVLVRSVTPGVPFGTPGGNMTVSEVTAGSGTVTRASVQAATGPWHWNNIKNWDTGSVPVNDDVVVFKDTTNGPKYGLPNGSLEVTLNVYQSFTGTIGLPLLNANGYTEYRQTYLRLDDAGSGTNIAHRFGLGQTGAGSPLINLKHTALKCSPIIYNTGQPVAAGTKALNLCCTVNTSTLDIVDGSVNWGSQDGGTSAFVSVSQTSGESAGINGLYTTAATLSVRGGRVLIGGTGAVNLINVFDGTLRIENQTGAINTLAVVGGAVEYNSTGTISTLNMLGGLFDSRPAAGGFTITDLIIYKGSRFLDPYGRATYTNPAALFFDPSPDLQFGASPVSGVGIIP